MERGQFYITLPAGGGKRHHPDNTLAEFTTELANPVELRRQKYAVGLSEIQLDSRIYNIKNDETCMRVIRDRKSIARNKDYFSKYAYMHNSTPNTNLVNHIVEVELLEEWLIDSLTVMYPVVFPKGYYNNLQQYIDALNEVIQQSPITCDLYFTVMNYAHGKVKQEIYLESRNSELNLTDEVDFKIQFYNSLYECVTLLPKKTNEMGIRLAVNVKKLLPEEESFLYIYTNIITHQAVGDSSSRLLRIVHLPQGRARHHSIVYTSPDYLPLDVDTISLINIYIRGTDGTKVLFEDGSLTVKLHLIREHE